MICENYNIVLKIYEQNAKDTWNTNRLRKKKILKGWRAEKRKKPFLEIIQLHWIWKWDGGEKKVENVYSNVNFQTFYTFNPLSWHKLYFSFYWNTVIRVHLVLWRSSLEGLRAGPWLRNNCCRLSPVDNCHSNCPTQRYDTPYNTASVILYVLTCIFVNTLFTYMQQSLYTISSSCESIKQSN